MQINTTSDALDNLNKKLGGADIEIEPSTNKVDALKKIYKTLGGTDDVKGLSTVYQVLEKITEVAEGGGGSSVLFLEEDENGSIGVSYNDLKDALDDNILPVLKYDSEGTYGVFYLATIFHNEGENYGADFGGDMYVADTPTDPLVFSD